MSAKTTRIFAFGEMPATPGTVSGVTLTPGFNIIYLQWVFPTTTPVASVLIYESATTTQPGTPTFSIASPVTYLARDGLPANTLRYYWLQVVGVNGRSGAVAGPFSATTKAGVGSSDILAGAILATHVAANQIITSSANIGNLVVDTINLQNNAVTIPVSAYTDGAVTCLLSHETTIQSAAINASGAPVFINFAAIITGGTTGGSGGPSCTFKVKRGSTVLLTITCPLNATYNDTGGFWSVSNSLMNYQITDIPSAGTYTYSVTVIPVEFDTTATNRSLCLLMTKK